MLLNAGCKEKQWEFTNGIASEYKWVGQNGSELLANGVCIERGYQKHFVPEEGRTKVHCNIEKQKLRAVDAKKKTISLDFTLTMRWLDPHIRTNEDYIEKDIVLSPKAIEMIWTPDMHIWNRARSFDNEWRSMISSMIMSTNKRNQLDVCNDTNNHHTKTGIEMRYEISTTVFCEFEHSNFPMDQQTCNISYGSGSSSAIFALYDWKQDFPNQHQESIIKRTDDFEVSMSFFDQGTCHGNNIVGITVEMKRVTTSFILKYYIPCMAIVLVSVIGFVFPISAIPGRTALLVTQFLTLINLFISQMVI